ncbi:UNVERIFIED_CONTAM: hypothetical protein GTU68_049699 [Idotea baltica]|nr:hypothetical protein [Idotea baltica]
MSKAKFFLED